MSKAKTVNWDERFKDLLNELNSDRRVSLEQYVELLSELIEDMQSRVDAAHADLRRKESK